MKRNPMSWHLLHLLALALVLYICAVIASRLGVALAFLLFLIAGGVVEITFWGKLFGWIKDDPN